MGHGKAQLLSQFYHHAHDAIQLHRSSGVLIVEQRGSVAAHRFGAMGSLIAGHRYPHAQGWGHFVGLGHNGTGDGAGLGVSRHLNKCGPGESTHGVEDDISEKLDPKVMTDPGPDGAL